MITKVSKYQISSEDLLAIKKAKADVENISSLMQGLNKIGSTIETGISKISAKQIQWLQEKIHAVLLLIVKSNLKTMQKGKSFKLPSNKTYKTLVTSSGVLGGVFGAPAFAADLTITTKFMMRSILDIARSEGEDISKFDTQLSCLQVFAIGGKSKMDDDLETSYYTSRIALNSAVQGAANYVAKHGTTSIIDSLLLTNSNPLLKLIGSIASRYSVHVSEKFALQALPIAGAIGGGSINFIFINHFQKMASAHFTIRRLERKYDEISVKEAYESINI